jgi:hypothetical protein
MRSAIQNAVKLIYAKLVQTGELDGELKDAVLTVIHSFDPGFRA